MVASNKEGLALPGQPGVAARLPARLGPPGGLASDDSARALVVEGGAAGNLKASPAPPTPNQ
eukprot:12467880-Alexandrium_andersonii.AAC.1